MTWYLTFDSVFWLSMGGVIVGAFSVAVNACIKSKCSNLSLCYGLFSCQRDTQAEVELEEHRIDMGQPPETQTVNRV
jgi:hypothetical protein